MAILPETIRLTPPASQAVRWFGRYQLIRLLGKSSRTLVWDAIDPRRQQELLLVMPRAPLPQALLLERWMNNVQRAARLDHPSLAPALDVGEHERWPYVAYERAAGPTLYERLTRKGVPGSELAPWAVQALHGLAFAHEAGASHHDLQCNMLLWSQQGTAQIIGMEVACLHDLDGGAAGIASLQAQRKAAERDVLAFGLVLNHALSGQPALDLPDTSAIIGRMPPFGRDIVRLAWSTTHSVPDALRVIINRSSDRQERQRYRSARTLCRALEGWITAQAGQDGGPLALLLERIRHAGLLPSSPGAAARAARLALMERGHTGELAEIVQQDAALSLELLRLVNAALDRLSNEPVLTLRRAIAMLGMDGVRRAALAIREWPGPLAEAAALELGNLIDRTKRAGQIAIWLRPPGYDPEVVFLVALMQNLGRLIVQYHFPDEAQQIRRLMQAAPAIKPGDPDEPGMSEESAAFAVLGTDLDSLSCAVLRHWGLDDNVLHMTRRVPASATVHAADTDADRLRSCASAANEVVDAGLLAAHLQASALPRIAQRYGRALGINLRDLQAVAQGRAPGSDKEPSPVSTAYGALA